MNFYSLMPYLVPNNVNNFQYSISQPSANVPTILMSNPGFTLDLNKALNISLEKYEKELLL